MTRIDEVQSRADADIYFQKDTDWLLAMLREAEEQLKGCDCDGCLSGDEDTPHKVFLAKLREEV
jgi:hypothetical protein